MSKLILACLGLVVVPVMSHAQVCADAFAEPKYALYENEFVVVEMQNGFGEKVLSRGRLWGLSERNGRTLYELSTDVSIKKFDSAAVFSRVPVREVRAVVLHMNVISQSQAEGIVTLIAARIDPKAPAPVKGEDPTLEYVGLMDGQLVRVLKILP